MEPLISIIVPIYKVEKYLETPKEKKLSNWDELNAMFLKVLETEQ